MAAAEDVAGFFPLVDAFLPASGLFVLDLRLSENLISKPGL